MRSACDAWTSWGMLYDFPRNICLRGVMVIDRKTDNMNWHENIPRDFHRVNRSCSHVRTADRSKRRAVTTAVKRSLPQESGQYRRRAVTIAGERSLPQESGHYRWRTVITAGERGFLSLCKCCNTLLQGCFTLLSSLFEKQQGRLFYF